MSLWGKISLSISVVSLIVIMLVSFLLGAWVPALNIFFGLLCLGVLLAVIVDCRFYLSFLLMRTTRSGMTMGAVIAITVVFCSSLAYLSKRFETSIDITEEKINSLSPLTLNILQNLKEDIHIVVFYKGKGQQKKELLKNSLQLFKQKSSKVQMRYYDAYVQNKLSQEYLNAVSTGKTENLFVFVEYKSRKILVDFPFSEEKITSAMIKATREKEQSVYFLSGHGERDLSGSEGEGLSEFKSAMEQSAIHIIDWNFIQNGPLPSDVSALMIVGPQQAYLPKELEWIEQYLLNGGSAFIALDPDRKDNLKPWLKKFGVDYKELYIRDPQSLLVGLGPFSPVGLYFDTENVITRYFHRNFALFHIAGPLAMTTQEHAFAITDLVRTSPQSVAVSDRDKREGEQASHTLALLVEKTKKEELEIKPNLEKKEKQTPKDKKENMKLVIFGDSDFLTNDLINKGGVNRDLALNAVSHLLDEADLVSIRPKRLKATQLILKTYDQWGIILLCLILPICFFTLSFIIWLKRRTA